MSGVLATNEIPVGQGVSLIRENGQAETFRVEAPGGGATLVASYYNASSADLSAIPELNGVFYTVPAGQAGLYLLSVTFTTPAAFAPGVDSAQVAAYLNGAPGLDTVLINEPFKLFQGGEGTQAFLAFTRPADLLLNDGDTIHLTSNSGGTVSVVVRLELLALVASL